MPAELESMFAAFDTWHGQHIPTGVLTAQEALDTIGNFTVKKEPVTVGDIQVPNTCVTVRMDKANDDPARFLGIVTDSYQVIQNEDAFKFFDPVVSRDDGRFYHSGGILSGGRKFWMLAKVPGDFWVIKDDRIESYLLLANSHDGTFHFTIKATTVRVCCANTLGMALGQEAQYEIKIKHTTNAQHELAMAHHMVGLATKRSEVLKEALEAFVKKPIRESKMMEILERVFPPQDKDDPSTRAKNVWGDVVELALGAEDCKQHGTCYGFYQAGTRYIDHHWTAKETTDTTDRSWFGEGTKKRGLLFRLIDKVVRE